MPRLFGARTLVTVLRTGNARARLRAARDGQAGVRLHVAAAGLATGVLDAVADGAGSTPELARRLGVAEEELLGAFLAVLAAGRLVRGDAARWELAAAGRAVVGDDLVRATYEAFAGFHTGLYRDLGDLLAGGPRRRDVAEQGAVVARVSAAFEPFVDDVLREVVAAAPPRRVLDVGCGAGLQLATVLAAAPGAEGVGVDVDADAAALARRTLEQRGLAGRATVVQDDVRRLPRDRPFDLALAANVVYYLPVEERAALFADVAARLAPGGTLLVVTTVATPQLFSRHFDLLLRAQEGAMSLPSVDELTTALRDAGLRPREPRRIAPGAPLVAVAAVRPS
ncbi:methyltransferase domain-containing protein [Blastococcus sp. MG754426]|uniref:SAM-dependent methyltransferase n=1 Tax=unclassified Blastococcus TaxID=2619396 RepID=UPI001EEF9AF2|nr:MULTISPECIES: class I SAM-dependent methyltransferase [unclassified Blastococcus]MCF6509279.1 methyltransferase domain-containing protein [Blastococcus sp. MG754426]MCF6512481.1 methyltransferase domain-containing protein [Blastococcus sp. MG754427]